MLTSNPTPSPLAPPDSQLHSMNLATRHSCVKIEGWGALVSSWVGRHGWGQGTDADGLGQMEMFEDEGGGGHRSSGAQ